MANFRNISTKIYLLVQCCRFNDPDYLKHEKLDIMVKLANDKNVDQLLMELKEYTRTRDVY